MKTEERIRKILDEQTQRQIDTLDKHISGIFLYGILIGVVLSYSGIIGFFSGFFSGVILTKKYNYLAIKILDLWNSRFYNSVLNFSNIISAGREDEKKEE